MPPLFCSSPLDTPCFSSSDQNNVGSPAGVPPSSLITFWWGTIVSTNSGRVWGTMWQTLLAVRLRRQQQTGRTANFEEETLKNLPFKGHLHPKTHFWPIVYLFKGKKKKHNLIFFCWHQTNPFKRKIINSYKKLLCSNTEFMYFRDKRSAFQSKRLLLLLQHNSLGSKQL